MPMFPGLNSICDDGRSGLKPDLGCIAATRDILVNVGLSMWEGVVDRRMHCANTKLMAGSR